MQTAPKKPFVSDKLARRRKAAAKAKRIVALVVFVAILSLGIYIIYGSRFQIKGITVAGAQAVPAEDISQTTDTIISGKRLYIFPRRNMFLYSKKDLEATLATDFPRLEHITIGVENKQLSIVVTERDPAYLWCGETIPVSRQASFESTCYFVDATGYIFSVAPQFSDTVYKRMYTTLPQSAETQGSESGEAVNPIGKYAMSTNVLSRIATFAKQIESPYFTPTAYSITSDGDALIFFYRDSDVYPAIRYNPLHDPLTVVAQFKSAITTEPLKTKLATDMSKLDYIDVRFPNKIFYKFSDDTGQQQDGGKQVNSQPTQSTTQQNGNH